MTTIASFNSPRRRPTTALMTQSTARIAAMPTSPYHHSGVVGR